MRILLQTEIEALCRRLECLLTKIPPDTEDVLLQLQTAYLLSSPEDRLTIATGAARMSSMLERELESGACNDPEVRCWVEDIPFFLLEQLKSDGLRVPLAKESSANLRASFAVSQVTAYTFANDMTRSPLHVKFGLAVDWTELATQFTQVVGGVSVSTVGRYTPRDGGAVDMLDVA